MPTVFAEVVVPRSMPDYNGHPTEGAWKEVTVYVPPGVVIKMVKGYMKNEPAGSAQVPAKPDTDYVGDIVYQPCNMERGESHIGWSAGRLLPVKSQENGGMAVVAKFANWAGRNDRTAKLEVSYNLKKEIEIYSEVIVPRTVPTPEGQPSSHAWQEVTVHVPTHCTISSIKGYMKNEPQGNTQIPIKPDTDSVGTTDYMECPFDSGECLIKWAAGRLLPTECTATGAMLVRAKFANWFYRNDRWAKLLVTYVRDNEQKSEKKSSVCNLQ